jgi:hypothetical protein
MEENPESSWNAGVPMPKIIARPERIANVHLGHHDMDGAGEQPLARRIAQDLVIAHLPFTTYQRFARKVDNIRSLLVAHPDMFPGHAAWHWKRWARIADEGNLPGEFRRQCLSAPHLQQLRSQGVVRSAAELFSQSRPKSYLS